jgi:hypothetical protein
MPGTPRSTISLLLGHKVALAVALIFLVPIMVSAPYLLRYGAQAIALAQSDADATATVTARHFEPAKGKAAANYVLDFQFTVPGRGLITTSQRWLSQDFWRHAAPGARLPVHYVPQTPEVAELERGRIRAYTLTIFWIMAPFALVGIAVLLLTWRKVRAARRVRLTGTPRAATITQIYPVLLGRSGTGATFSALWQDDTGGTGTTFQHSKETLPAVGASIIVYIDPQQRRPAVWDGDVST